jgi:hypothetical protein
VNNKTYTSRLRRKRYYGGEGSQLKVNYKLDNPSQAYDNEALLVAGIILIIIGVLCGIYAFLSHR